jgi:4-amino-4-deoxy-L-arabinose transferase-like glycosyltransferase
MVTYPAVQILGRGVTHWLVIGAAAWFLILPLRDVLSFPARVSVLPNLEADAAAYDAFAWDFARNGRLDALPTKHPPGWMLMLAGIYTVVGHSYVAGKLLSWSALLVTVVLCGWLAARVYGPYAAAIAALLCASSPGLRGYVGTLQYEVVTAFWFMLFLVLSGRAAEGAGTRDAAKRAAIAGLVGAALVLTRETFVPVVVIAAVWLRSQVRGHTGRSVVVGVFVVAASAPPLLWSTVQTVRNDRLIVIAEKGPREFQLGNHALANGTYNEPLVGMAEPAGLDFIRTNPGRAVQLVVRKALYMFGVLRDGWTVPNPLSVWIWRASTGVLPLEAIEPVVRGGWLLVTCVIALLSFGAQRWQRWWILPASIAIILAEHVATLGSFRFGVPLLPALYVLASGPLERMTYRLKALLRAPAPMIASAAIVTLSVLAQFRVWPLTVEYAAASLDGLAAANATDSIAGQVARVADARRGIRPVVILPDTFLPRGSVAVTVTLRPHAASRAPIARLALTHLDGTAACAEDIAGDRPTDRFSDVSVRCQLRHDGPVTLAIFSLGHTDVSFERIRLVWGSGAGSDRSRQSRVRGRFPHVRSTSPAS